MASSNFPSWAQSALEDLAKGLHFQATGAWLLDERFEAANGAARRILAELAQGWFEITTKELEPTRVAYFLSQEGLGDLGRVEINQFADTMSTELTVVRPSRPPRRRRTPEETATLEAISDLELRHRAVLDLEKKISDASDELYDRRLERYGEVMRWFFELMEQTGILGNLKPYSHEMSPETDQQEEGHSPGYEPYIFREVGDFWEIAFESEPTHLKDLKGLHYIACLLCHPRRNFHVSELVACVEKNQADPAAAPYGRMTEEQLAENGLHLELGATSDSVADGQTIQECLARKAEIGEEISRYTDLGDDRKVEELQDEKEKIDAYLKAAAGLHGRQRKFSDEDEKARVSIQKAIRKALDTILDRNVTA
jgi:hypothetical protein